MLYRVAACRIREDGSIQTARREILYQHPTILNVGGLYMLGHLKKKRLFKILGVVPT